MPSAKRMTPSVTVAVTLKVVHSLGATLARSASKTAAGEKGGAGVRARRAPRAPVPVGQVAVAGRVDRLHRGDHPQPPEPPQVLLAHELDVLDPLAQGGRGRSRRRDRVQGDSYGAVADEIGR